MTEAKQPLVKLENVHKSYGENHVLRGISLAVNHGEVVAIIGASGGGKSTLLRCTTLLERFDAGGLSYGDLEVAHDEAGVAVYGSKTVLQEAKQRFGLVFQNYNLFPHYTVLKNLMDAPVCVQKRDPAEVEAEARKLLERMGLAGNENKVPCELSGGQQQRVKIAKAVISSPSLIVLDEPDAGMDHESHDKLIELLENEHKQNGKGIVFISHHLHDLANADAIYQVRGGTVKLFEGEDEHHAAS